MTKKSSGRRSKPKRGSKPKGPSKKEVATFAALLKGRNKSN